MVSRHEFLARLHELLRPDVYLEVGVQYGTSLALAANAEVAIGVDPNPLIQPVGNQMIYRMHSSVFFESPAAQDLRERPIDFAFIDGSHLFEDAWLDFNYILECSHERTVIVFDDVLPLNQQMAAREMCPGDWTGDVWRVHDWVRGFFPAMNAVLIDTFPTGLLMCWDVLVPPVRITDWTQARDLPNRGTPVPDHVLQRTDAVSPEEAMALISDWWLA